MKKSKNFLFGLAIGVMLIPTIIYAAPTKLGSSSSSASVTYVGGSTISSSTTLSDKSYSSTSGSENALLVSGGTSTINSITVTKSGDASGDEVDFYGTNAAVLVYNGATVNINGGTITTNGSHANAVFSYGSGTINISDATITTSASNSGGVMVTGGGTLTANNLTVKTSGNSSASIRSDRGGGTLTVNGGTYETSGTGSPAIYSTADITVNNSSLTSTASEGIVVEGANSATLNNVVLTDTNNKLNGNSETYKNIFLYQSMSGDASEGTASFTAKDSTITTNKGDDIFVTNTNATIKLENNTFVNNDNDGDFLRVQAGKWGTSGSNGGNVTLSLTNQKVSGGIIIDSISTLNLTLENGSVFSGTIDNENQAKEINLSLSSDSVIYLTNDSYIDSLTNEDSDNSNIYLNGHKLYVNGKEVSANDGEYTGTLPETSSNASERNTENNNFIIYIIVLAFVVLLASTAFIIKKKRANH